MESTDDGLTWATLSQLPCPEGFVWAQIHEVPDGDHGYPSTVELSDGSLFTVYYQKYGDDPHCSILSSRWTLPEK